MPKGMIEKGTKDGNAHCTEELEPYKNIKDVSSCYTKKNVEGGPYHHSVVLDGVSDPTYLRYTS